MLFYNEIVAVGQALVPLFALKLSAKVSASRIIYCCK